MKAKEMHRELLSAAKQLGITVRRGDGKFRSGHCTVNASNMIVVNRTTPIDAVTKIIAQGLSTHDIEAISMKPIVREFIEKERDIISFEKNFNLEVNY